MAPLSRTFCLDLSDGRCHRADCVVCKNHKGRGSSKCKRKSIVYESACMVCSKNGSRNGVYIGESSRSLYERSLEHLYDADKRRHSSHIFKHWALSHGEMTTQPEFKFTVLRSHSSALDRQLHEAIKIATDGELNARCEYRQNLIKRLSVELTAKELKAAEREAMKGDAELVAAVKNLEEKLSSTIYSENKSSTIFTKRTIHKGFISLKVVCSLP